jgi:SAM-dependent methyltransferase
MSKFCDFPIFIVNYNQLACLKSQLEWLVNAGHRNICVLDNCSTYPALLRYYEEVEHNYKGIIKIIVLERNFGCRGVLTTNVLDRFMVEKSYVYSDGDVVPDKCCPANAVEYLVSLLDEHPEICKAGLGLRIDDLPDTYQFREQAALWEGQYWQRPVAPGLFRAPIDTTFAVYRPGTPFRLEPALRTGWPYIARHQPWYSLSSQPSEEERFYRESVKVHDTHWAGNRIPEWLETACTQLAANKKRLLNIGCGHNTMGGWINIDARTDVGADVVYDLNSCASEKLPFADETIDGFYMHDILGRIRDPFAALQELYRVAKPNAKLIARGIHYPSSHSGVATYRDVANTFTCFGQLAHCSLNSRYSGDWLIKRVKIIVLPHLQDAGIQLLSRPLASFARDIVIELAAIKPKQLRKFGSSVWPTPTFATVLIDDEISF